MFSYVFYIFVQVRVVIKIKYLANTCINHRYKESGLAIECSVWHYPLRALQSKPTIWPTTFYLKLIFIYTYKLIITTILKFYLY